MIFGPKFQYFFQLNEMRDEAKTWWLVSGPDVASSYFFKRKSVLYLNHEIPTGSGKDCQQFLSYKYDLKYKAFNDSIEDNFIGPPTSQNNVSQQYRKPFEDQ